MSRTFHTDGEVTRRDLLAANAPEAPHWFMKDEYPQCAPLDEIFRGEVDPSEHMAKVERYNIDKMMKWPYYYADSVLKNR